MAAEVMARNSILTGGLALSYDYQDRSGDDQSQTLDFDADDYSRLVLTPLIRYVSSSQRDRFELSYSPEISRDLDDSETDWNDNVFLAANRDITKAWQLYVSDQFLRSDTAYTANAPNVGVTVANQGQQPVAPQLSQDQGRRRYYRNTFNVGTDALPTALLTPNMFASTVVNTLNNPVRKSITFISGILS